MMAMEKIQVKQSSLLLCVILLHCFLLTKTQDMIISTIAGSGVRGTSGNGGPATSASFLSPQRVAVDSSGNVYIADDASNHFTIRKLSTTGIIDKFAGTNGIWGTTSDGANTTSSIFSSLSGIAVDAAGNVYASDMSAARIYKMTVATGKIYTIAGGNGWGASGDGGPATSAQLYSPYGLAVDSSDNVYVAERFKIRKITAATSIISTVAGTGAEGSDGDGGAATSASLNYPYGVAVDSSGNLYIADSGNSKIRKVVSSTGIISTFAGTGVQGSSGDGGPATSAGLNSPYGVAVDSSGNLYILDKGNNKIRKVVSSTGIISTVAGTGAPGSSGDGGAATSAELYSPYGIAVDSSGNLYIADTSNFKVRKVVTTVISTTAPSMVPSLAPTSPAPTNTLAPTISPGYVAGITVSGISILLHFTLVGILTAIEEKSRVTESRVRL